MVPRALFSFVQAFLVVLVFLCGTPVMGIGGPQASAASWSMGVASAPAVRGDLTADISDGVINLADDDDPDDLIVRAEVVIGSPNVAAKPRILHADERARPTHRSCAAQPRAPPIA